MFGSINQPWHWKFHKDGIVIYYRDGNSIKIITLLLFFLYHQNMWIISDLCCEICNSYNMEFWILWIATQGQLQLQFPAAVLVMQLTIHIFYAYWIMFLTTSVFTWSSLSFCWTVSLWIVYFLIVLWWSSSHQLCNSIKIYAWQCFL